MNNDNDFDPVTRACRCEKCGELIYQAAPHQCKPLSQLDEAVRNRDYRIAELEAQINDAGDTNIGWYRQELSTSAVVLKKLRTRITEMEERLKAWPEIVQRRAELAVAGEKNRILKELSCMNIDPVLFIDIQATVVNYSRCAVGPTQNEIEDRS